MTSDDENDNNNNNNITTTNDATSDTTDNNINYITSTIITTSNDNVPVMRSFISFHSIPLLVIYPMSRLVDTKEAIIIWSFVVIHAKVSITW